MTFPPIVAREIKVLASNARFYWARPVLAGFAVLICVQWFTSQQTNSAAALSGQAGFGMLSLLGLIMALGATVVTADCVCHERREGTLTLLFLSTMKSRDIVLGKFAALGLVAFYVLLGFAPVLLLPLMTGGVTGGEVVRTALVLLNVLFVSLTAGLLVSVCARGQFEAILGAFGLLGAASLLPFFLEVIGRTTVAIPISIISPVFSFNSVSDMVYTAAPGKFWLSLVFGNLEGWLLLGAAVLALQRNWRTEYVPRALRAAAARTRRLIGASRVLLGDRENKRRAFAPVARAVLRLPRQRELAWVAAVISLLGSVWNAFVMNRLGSVWAATSVSIVISFASLGVFAFLAGRFFFEARRSGELELLQVTPVGARGILREQRLALLRMFRGPFYLVLLGSIPVAVGCISVNSGNELVGLLLGLCQLANAALGILAVCAVGMWFGTRANSSLAIVGYSVGLVEVLPLVVAYLVPIPFFGAAGVFQFWPVFVPLAFVLKNLFFIWWSWARLRREFRTNDRSVLDKLFLRLLSTAAVELAEPRAPTRPMTFLPIVDRELRLAARRQGTFWLRVSAAAVALVIGSGYFALLSATPFPGGFSLGGTLLAILSWLSLAVALSAGLFLTSDCLSEEKREGTLGLLFLTDLRGFDVVLGKLFATSLRSAFTFLALFPILATTFLLGGVESGLFWKSMLALLNALFFSLATGMLVSAISRNGQKALAGTLVLLALWMFGGLVVDNLVAAIQQRPVRAVFRLVSPLHVFQSANGWPRFFWQGLFVSQLMAWLQLALACVVIRRAWQDQERKAETGRFKWRSFWRRGGEKARRALREKWLERDPMLWLALRERGQLSFAWFWPALFVAGVIAAIVQRTGGRLGVLWGFLSGALSLVVYLSVAAQASQFFVEARRTRMVELLLAAPLDAKAIVMGPWRALVRSCSGLVLLLLTFQIGGTFLGLIIPLGFGFAQDATFVLVTVLMGVLVTVANLVAVGWFGLWMGMTSRNNLFATLKTIVFVQIVPWFIMTFAAIFLVPLVLLPTLMRSGAASTSTTWFSNWYPLLSTGLTAVLALGKDFFFWRWSRRKLMQDFREQATRVVAPIMIHPIGGAVPPPPPIFKV